MKSIVILFSYHHNNTEKVAKVIAHVLDAQVKNPQQVNPDELHEYDLIGFGSGIYGDKHHESLLRLADNLHPVTNVNAFLFSTSAMTNRYKVENDHSALREKLQSKGYRIVDEFACKGFNTNSFLKYIGGINKGRPNLEDIKNAEEFAQNLKKSC
jgi:flavodoxin